MGHKRVLSPVSPCLFLTLSVLGSPAGRMPLPRSLKARPGPWVSTSRSVQTYTVYRQVFSKDPQPWGDTGCVAEARARPGGLLPSPWETRAGALGRGRNGGTRDHSEPGSLRSTLTLGKRQAPCGFSGRRDRKGRGWQSESSEPTANPHPIHSFIHPSNT